MRRPALLRRPPGSRLAVRVPEGTPAAPPRAHRARCGCSARRSRFRRAAGAPRPPAADRGRAAGAVRRAYARSRRDDTVCLLACLRESARSRACCRPLPDRPRRLPVGLPGLLRARAPRRPGPHARGDGPDRHARAARPAPARRRTSPPGNGPRSPRSPRSRVPARGLLAALPADRRPVAHHERDAITADDGEAAGYGSGWRRRALGAALQPARGRGGRRRAPGRRRCGRRARGAGPSSRTSSASLAREPRVPEDALDPQALAGAREQPQALASRCAWPRSVVSKPGRVLRLALRRRPRELRDPDRLAAVAVAAHHLCARTRPAARRCAACPCTGAARRRRRRAGRRRRRSPRSAVQLSFGSPARIVREPGRRPSARGRPP